MKNRRELDWYQTSLDGALSPYLCDENSPSTKVGIEPYDHFLGTMERLVTPTVTRNKSLQQIKPLLNVYVPKLSFLEAKSSS